MTDPTPFRVPAVCTGNRARSQMAHGWLRSPGGNRVEVSSAGASPKGVHPVAVRMMDEVGIDISGHTPDHADQYADCGFDLVMTVCDSARESCPVIPGARQVLHHSFEDPDNPDAELAELMEVFRRVRDETGGFCRPLLETEAARETAPMPGSGGE